MTEIPWRTDGRWRSSWFPSSVRHGEMATHLPVNPTSFTRHILVTTAYMAYLLIRQKILKNICLNILKGQQILRCKEVISGYFQFVLIINFPLNSTFLARNHSIGFKSFNADLFQRVKKCIDKNILHLQLCYVLIRTHAVVYPRIRGQTSAIVWFLNLQSEYLTGVIEFYENKFTPHNMEIGDRYTTYMNHHHECCKIITTSSSVNQINYWEERHHQVLILCQCTITS